jgi:hypothetical protein
MAPFLALITPVGDTSPPGWDTFPKPMPQPPLGIWGGGNVPFPTPPIYMPGPPLGTWGGAGQPFPTPPMAPGGPPLGTWGGYRPPYVDAGLPGPQPGGPVGIWGGPFQPPYPSQGPGFPTPPIYFPPEPGQPPLHTWGGGNVPFPTPPIVIPPDMPTETPDGRPIEWKTGWTATTGWIVVGIPQGPMPTPSAG